MAHFPLFKIDEKSGKSLTVDILITSQHERLRDATFELAPLSPAKLQIGKKAHNELVRNRRFIKNQND